MLSHHIHVLCGTTNLHKTIFMFCLRVWVLQWRNSVNSVTLRLKYQTFLICLSLCFCITEGDARCMHHGFRPTRHRQSLTGHQTAWIQSCPRLCGRATRMAVRIASSYFNCVLLECPLPTFSLRHITYLASTQTLHVPERIWTIVLPSLLFDNPEIYEIEVLRYPP